MQGFRHPLETTWSSVWTSDGEINTALPGNLTVNQFNKFPGESIRLKEMWTVVGSFVNTQLCLRHVRGHKSSCLGGVEVA